MTDHTATDTPPLAPAVGAQVQRGVRPECWDFAMDFLGEPEAPIVAAYVEGLESEIERLRGKVAFLRATMEGATYQLSKARIWGGMEWHYNPLHPMHYKPALDRMREVLDRA